MLETINEDLKKSLKDGDKFKLSVLRMLKSALQNEAINKKKELEDEDVLTVLKRQVKQNSKERVKLGIKGVPTTFINGVELELGLSAEEFEEQIINLLEK